MMIEIKTVTDPTLDANSRFSQAFSKFVAVKNAVVSGSDGYVPHIQAISGNTVTVEVRRRGAITHTTAALQGGDLAATQSDHATAARHSDHAAAVLAAVGAGAITATFRIMAEGI
jgi:transcriptional regulator of nitric oxide reductase